MVYREAPYTRIVGVGWRGGIVIAEFKDEFNVRYESLNPVNDGTSIGGGRYAIGTQIPKDDYKEHIFFAAQDPNGFEHYIAEEEIVVPLTTFVPNNSFIPSPLEDFIENYREGGVAAWSGFTTTHTSEYGHHSAAIFEFSSEEATKTLNALAAYEADNYTANQRATWSHLADDTPLLSAPTAQTIYSIMIATITTKRTISRIINFRNTRLVKFRQAFFSTDPNPYEYELLVRLRAYTGGTFTIGEDKRLSNSGGRLLWEHEITTPFREKEAFDIVTFNRSGVIS